MAVGQYPGEHPINGQPLLRCSSTLFWGWYWPSLPYVIHSCSLVALQLWATLHKFEQDDHQAGSGRPRPGLHEFLSGKIAAMNFHGVFMCIFTTWGKTHPAESWVAGSQWSAWGSAWVCDGLRWSPVICSWFYCKSPRIINWCNFRRWYGRCFDMFQPSWMLQMCIWVDLKPYREKQIRKRARKRQTMPTMFIFKSVQRDTIIFGVSHWLSKGCCVCDPIVLCFDTMAYMDIAAYTPQTSTYVMWKQNGFSMLLT